MGGRGGRVIKVTNLNPDGPGSFAAAAAAEGPRIIVFDVSGVIRGDVALRHPYVSIFGQTAPRPGIILEGRLLARPADGERLHDVVIRFLRIRPRRAEGHVGDALQLPKSERVMLDHLSLSWSNDELVDIIHSSELTLQWSTLEESDTEGHDKNTRHNFGLISAYPGSGNISIHHNLFAHHSRRLPSLSPQEPDKPADFRNNVIYNFREGLGHDGHRPRAPVNLVGNYYKPGPSSLQVFPFRLRADGAYFLADNYLAGVGVLEDPRAGRQRLPAWVLVNRKGRRLHSPAPVAEVATDSAEEAYRRVLALAGTWPRDRVSRRTIDEVRSGDGSWGRHGPAAPDAGWHFAEMDVEAPLEDDDGDGLPDAWERRRGLDPSRYGDHSDLMSSGYTAIEQYAHERAQQLLVQPAPGRVPTAGEAPVSYPQNQGRLGNPYGEQAPGDHRRLRQQRNDSSGPSGQPPP